MAGLGDSAEIWLSTQHGQIAAVPNTMTSVLLGLVSTARVRASHLLLHFLCWEEDHSRPLSLQCSEIWSGTQRSVDLFSECSVSSINFQKSLLSALKKMSCRTATLKINK